MTEESQMHACCFFGHRKIPNSTRLKNLVYSEAENLIKNKNVTHFLFGSRSAFNDLSYEVVTLLKEKHPHVKRIYVRAEFQDINESFEGYLLSKYDETYFPKQISNAGKASYVERNREMIDKSQYCIIYYDENYVPPRRKYSKRNLTDYQPKSGTKLAYEYAVKKQREIINLCRK